MAPIGHTLGPLALLVSESKLGQSPTHVTSQTSRHIRHHACIAIFPMQPRYFHPTHTHTELANRPLDMTHPFSLQKKLDMSTLCLNHKPYARHHDKTQPKTLTTEIFSLCPLPTM